MLQNATAFSTYQTGTLHKIEILFNKIIHNQATLLHIFAEK